MPRTKAAGRSLLISLPMALLGLALCACTERSAGSEAPSPEKADEQVRPLETPAAPAEPEATPSAPAAPGSAGEVAEGDRRSLVEGNTRFAVDLLKALAKAGAGDNLFFSPFSISAALAMTYGGARSETAEQMAKALHFSLEQSKLHPTFKAVSAPLQADQAGKGYQLSVANALWGQAGLPFEQAFLASSQDNYGAGLQQVDFAKVEEAARIINSWVEKQTQDRIKNLVEPSMVAGALLVLTNAIYFKGDWHSQFEPEQTQAAPFHVTPKKQVKTALMSQKGKFGLVETPQLQLLELPYVGEELSMLIFLPREVGGLPALEQKLNEQELTQLLGQLHEREVQVHLPKFKLETEYELRKVLTGLGMGIAFSGDADFSGMCKAKLGISAVVHKAFVEVNEEGTEAAAATAVVMRGVAAAAPPAVFKADHPFLFAIRHRESNSLLFLGRLVDPGA